jgi:hypothetical protein
LADVNYIKKVTIEYLDGRIEEYEDESLFIVIINDETESYDIIPTEDVGEEVILDFGNNVIEMFENVFMFEPEQPQSHLRLVINNDS